MDRAAFHANTEVNPTPYDLTLDNYLIPHPDGCIGPHVDAILLCHSPVPRLLPKSSLSVWGLVWCHMTVDNKLWKAQLYVRKGPTCKGSERVRRGGEEGKGDGKRRGEERKRGGLPSSNWGVWIPQWRRGGRAKRELNVGRSRTTFSISSTHAVLHSMSTGEITWRTQNAPKLLATGALPRTPLGSIQHSSGSLASAGRGLPPPQEPHPGSAFRVLTSMRLRNVDSVPMLLYYR